MKLKPAESWYSAFWQVTYCSLSGHQTLQEATLWKVIRSISWLITSPSHMLSQLDLITTSQGRSITLITSRNLLLTSNKSEVKTTQELTHCQESVPLWRIYLQQLTLMPSQMINKMMMNSASCESHHHHPPLSCNQSLSLLPRPLYSGLGSRERDWLQDKGGWWWWLSQLAEFIIILLIICDGIKVNCCR